MRALVFSRRTRSQTENGYRNVPAWIASPICFCSKNSTPNVNEKLLMPVCITHAVLHGPVWLSCVCVQFFGTVQNTSKFEFEEKQHSGTMKRTYTHYTYSYTWRKEHSEKEQWNWNSTILCWNVFKGRNKKATDSLHMWDASTCIWMSYGVSRHFIPSELFGENYIILQY